MGFHCTRILEVVYNICSEMYHEALPIVVCCVLHGWSEHHTAKGCAHSSTSSHQFWVQSALPSFNSVRIILRYMSGSSGEELNLVVSEIC